MGQRKTLSPDRIQTYDLPNTGRALYSLELWTTHGESEAIYKLYI